MYYLQEGYQQQQKQRGYANYSRDTAERTRKQEFAIGVQEANYGSTGSGTLVVWYLSPQVRYTQKKTWFFQGFGIFFI